MSNNIRKQLQIGEKLEFHNQSSLAISISLEMDDGTEVSVTLAPGADINIKAGTTNLTAYINDVEGEDGLRIVRDD